MANEMNEPFELPAARARTAYRRQVLELIEEAVLDVPNLAILRVKPAESLIAEFEATWGLPPQSVVLPITSQDGVNFDNTCGLPTSFAYQFDRAVQAFAKRDCAVYLSIDPGFPFVNAPSVHIRDSAGESSRQMCLVRDTSREFLSQTIADAIDIAMDSYSSLDFRGIVFDVVDVWPMGSDDKRLELTCFCDRCVAGLARFGSKSVLSALQDFPSPANLLLAESPRGTGIRYADNFASTVTAEQILGISRAKGFIDAFISEPGGLAPSQDLSRMAEVARSYVVARHDLTVESVRQITEEAWSRCAHSSADGQKLILLTEGAQYDWTSGLFLDRLDRKSRDAGIDEVWFDVSPASPRLESIKTRAYMTRRARYFIDAFFQFLNAVVDPGLRATTGIGRLDEETAKAVAQGRLGSALGVGMEGFSQLVALHGDFGGRSFGFVGVGFDEKVGTQLISEMKVAPGLASM